jgi:hypothetical protein
MNRQSAFWGLLLILIGVLFIFGNLLQIDVWGLVWPIVLILLGAWIVWGVISGQQPRETEVMAIPLDGASRARVHLRHGAGRLTLGPGVEEGELLSGSFDGGVDHQSHREGDGLDVKIRVPVGDWSLFATPWTRWQRGGLEWRVALNGSIPLDLDLGTGASESRLDLRELQVTSLRLNTGASATELTLPAHAGFTEARLRSGAASLNVWVPEGVAARIRASGGLAEIAVDRERFPRQGSFYQSPDYETAVNRVDLDIETGVGSVRVS